MSGFLQRRVSDDFQWSLPDPPSSEHPFQPGELPDDPFLLARWVAGLDGEHPLEAGQVLEDRFHIVREVGHGGMGIVYEALDGRLDRRIAIKCARAGFRKRLSPEVRHASEISHPNVCKTYEIHTADTGRGEIDFITMEFIDGQTLGERLREGPVPKREAEIVAKQLCAGLAEAHRRQVIHGDLKSNNVLLARGPDGVRAVITDFGLARHWQPQAAIQSGEAGGALDYMAPELFRGARPSAASDIYALGVILHELANGRKPFGGEMHWEERLTRRPAPLQHRWRRIVARCLEPDRGRRPSLAEVSIALGPSRLIRRWGTAAAAVVIAGLAGAIAYRAAPAEMETIRLAVLPFETDRGSKPLSDGLLQDTADRLTRVKPSIRPMPGWFDSHSRAKLTIIPIGDAARNHVDRPEKAAKMLGATHTLTGVLRRDNRHISIHARLSDARSGLPLKEWQADYAPNELQDMPVALAGMVTGTLRLPPQPSAPTVNPAAYADFVAGVALSRRSTGVDAAIPLLERAVAADPDSPLTHARLAEAEVLKYGQAKAENAIWLERSKKSLQDAERRNPDLAVVRLVSGMINECEGSYGRAESDLRRGLDIEPMNGDVWRRLGSVYRTDKRFTEALAAFRKAIEVQPDYFKNHQELCALYVDQANYKEAVRQCQEVAQLAPDLSDAHLVLAIAYWHSEQYAECESELRIASKLDPDSSRALQTLAVVLFYRSKFAEAIPLLRRAIQAGPPTILMYLDLGTNLQMIGQMSEAGKTYRKGLAMAEEELEENPRDGSAKSVLALLCARLGQRTRAASEARQARRLAADDVEVAKLLVRTYDVLRERERTFELIQNFPDSALRGIDKSPDLADLHRDSRFKQLMVSRHIQ